MAKIKKEDNKEEGPREELEDMKALLILLLDKFKVKRKDIANALGCSEGRISQMLDKNKYGGKKESKLPREPKTIKVD